MANLFQTAVYLGGSMVFFCLLVLPSLFLLAISVIYMIVEAIQYFRERHGLS